MQEDMSMTYSYGGTKEAPLVRRTVRFTYDPAVHQTMQEACIERCDALLDDLCTVFDDAEKEFSDNARDKAERLKSLDVMVSTVVYTVKGVLVLAPDARYAVMYDRIQRVLNLLPTVEKVFNKAVRTAVAEKLKEPWEDLRTIDSTFVRTRPAEG